MHSSLKSLLWGRCFKQTLWQGCAKNEGGNFSEAVLCCRQGFCAWLWSLESPVSTEQVEVHRVFCICDTWRGLRQCLPLSHVASAASEESIPTVGLKGTQESSGSSGASLLQVQPPMQRLSCPHVGHECSIALWKPDAVVLLWFCSCFLKASDCFCHVTNLGFIYLLAEVHTAVLWSLQTHRHQWNFKKDVSVVFKKKLILTDSFKKVTFI